MILEQKRIRSLSKLSIIKEGTIITPIIKIDDENIVKVNQIGFSDKLEIGESILPKVVGAVTRRNANGYDIKHKELPKETYYIMREWTYKKWIGGGETEEVTEFVDVPRKRYQRTHIDGMESELRITLDAEENKVLALPSIEFSEDNKEKIVNEINIMLEIFGKCEIVNENLENIIEEKKVKKLNWTVLPKGKYPWIKNKDSLDRFIRSARGKNSNIIRKRLELIYSYNPDFIAIGNGGFYGYVILGFESKETYILESTQINNATYVLEKDWEEISKMTKAQIISNQYCKDRIIHNRHWFDSMDVLLGRNL